MTDKYKRSDFKLYGTQRWRKLDLAADHIALAARAVMDATGFDARTVSDIMRTEAMRLHVGEPYVRAKEGV